MNTMNPDYTAALANIHSLLANANQNRSAPTVMNNRSASANHHQTFQHQFPSASDLQACFSTNLAPAATNGAADCTTTEATVSEALMALGSVAAAAVAPLAHQATQQVYSTPGPTVQYHQQPPTAAAGYAPPQPPSNWQMQVQPQVVQATANHHTMGNNVILETPLHKSTRRVSSASLPSMANGALYHAKPVFAQEDAALQAANKKARTVSPAPLLPSSSTGRLSPTTNNVVIQNQHHAYAPTHPSARQQRQEVGGTPDSVSCICPVCNRQIKGLGEHKVDWSQPVQGRQRAKTITSIKKHVKDFHENEPIWNVIVNSLDIATGKSSSSSVTTDTTTQQQSRVVTAQAFVTQALKKAALDQIPNTKGQLRSFRWTEKMLDQRVGIAKGFIQFGGQEYLRNKECQDENGIKVNPKSLRILAYCLLQSMYDELLQAWNRNQSSIEEAMQTAPLGLLRNRFQLLFAAPDQWAGSWYMDPSKYSDHNTY